MWALSSYSFHYLFMVFKQPFVSNLKPHCFHLDSSLKRYSNLPNWLSRIPTQSSLVNSELLFFINIQYTITSTFKGKECGRCKLESAHHYGAPYLYLPKLMGNASCLPSLFTKPRSTPKISITASHWTGQSITHHLATWIETGGLRSWPNSPIYAVPLLSKSRYSSSMDTIVISMTAP